MKHLTIAQNFAAKEGLGIVTYCTTRNGIEYFQLSLANKPRYTGHPLIVAINNKGEINWVNDTPTIYWAAAQIKEHEQ